MAIYDVTFTDAQGKESLLTIATQEGMFSPRGLDRGTEVMLSVVQRENLLQKGFRVLDLGCGAGVVGLWANLQGADVTCVDIDPVAVEQTKANFARNHLYLSACSCSDGLVFWKESEKRSPFELILSNPPYHTDYRVAKHFIEDGFAALTMNGKMILVVKRALWYQNKLKSIFGGCTIRQEDGYTVLLAEKKTLMPAFVLQKRAKKARRQQEREQQYRFTQKKKHRFKKK